MAADPDSIKVTFEPLEEWPGKATVNRKPNPFRPRSGGWNSRMPWSDTLWLLKTELSHIGATLIVFQIALTREQIRKDGLPRSGSSPKHPGVIISFHSRGRHLRFKTDRFDHWEVNVRAIAKALEALRLVERYEVTSDGEQYAGFVAIEQTSSAGLSQIDLGEQLIGLHGGVTEALKATHPDRGGNEDEFMAVQAARKARG